MDLRGHFLGVGRSLLTFAIILEMAFLPVAQAKDTSNSTSSAYTVFTGNQNFSDEDFLKSSDQFNENEKAFIETYFNEPARVTLDLMILSRALAEKAEDLTKTIVPGTDQNGNVIEKPLGQKGVADNIRSRDQNKEIKVEIPGLGKAEFNSLGYKENGRIFTRFVHYQTNTAYVFIDTDVIKTDELTEQDLKELGVEKYKDEYRRRNEARSELDRYVALQQMHTPVYPDEYNPFPDISQIKPEEAKDYLVNLLDNAKKNPPKKNYDSSVKIEKGRTVKVIFYSGKDQVVKQIKEYARYTDLTPLQRVAIYWRSVKQGTRLNWEYWDHGKWYQKPLSFLTGDVLVSLFSTIAQTGIFATLAHNPDPITLTMVAGWAFAFSITPTARNWVNVNPSKSAVLFKSFLNSVIFNYVLMTALQGSDVVFSLSLAALNAHFAIITNALINNFGKVWWYKVPQMRQRAGKNLREVNLLGIHTKVDQSSFEQQAWYLGSNVIRTADLIGMGALFTVLGIDFTWSRMAMLLSIPTMHYIIMKYAEKHDFKEKKILREEWEKANVPFFYLGASRLFLGESWIIAKNTFMAFYWLTKVPFEAMLSASKYTLNQLMNMPSYTRLDSQTPKLPVCSTLF